MSLELDVRKDKTGNISVLRYSDRYRIVQRVIGGVETLVVLNEAGQETPICEKSNTKHMIDALESSMTLWPAQSR